MYVCIYIYLYVDVCIHISIHTYAFTHMYIHIYIHIHMYLRICTYIYMYMHTPVLFRYIVHAPGRWLWGITFLHRELANCLSCTRKCVISYTHELATCMSSLTANAAKSNNGMVELASLSRTSRRVKPHTQISLVISINEPCQVHELFECNSNKERTSGVNAQTSRNILRARILMYVWMCMCVCACAFVCLWTFVHVFVNVGVYVCVCVRMNMYLYA